jgi:hypothetical protein
VFSVSGIVLDASKHARARLSATEIRKLGEAASANHSSDALIQLSPDLYRCVTRTGLHQKAVHDQSNGEVADPRQSYSVLGRRVN